MNVTQLLKQSDMLKGLVSDSRRLVGFAEETRRAGIFKRYIAANLVAKLQLGAGTNVLEGWLSTDLEPQSERVMHLDATKPFPFPDACFDYVYSEHMIEHISWKQGTHMLGECLRVLKPGGRLRIATPDLRVLLGLYDSKDPAGIAYVKWVTDLFLEGVGTYKPSFVINNAFRNWGHQFLYDGELLEMALQQAGFSHLERHLMGQSTNPVLQNIESHGTVVDPAMVAFETMVFEAVRPS